MQIFVSAGWFRLDRGDHSLRSRARSSRHVILDSPAKRSEVSFVFVAFAHIPVSQILQVLTGDKSVTYTTFPFDDVRTSILTRSDLEVRGGSLCRERLVGATRISCLRVILGRRRASVN